MTIKTIFRAWVIYALLAFPLFYFVYKYGSPDFGLKDFYDYYKLYLNWDIEQVDAPFNMRLLSSFIVYLMNKTGLNYDTSIAFESTGLQRSVFFNAIFFNYLCVVTTCVLIFIICRKHFENTLLSFSGGILYLLGFGTIFYELMPITDALSVFLFAFCYHYYLQKSYKIVFPLLLLIIQREYVFLALGLLAFIDYIKYREKYFLISLLICIFCFSLYLVMRKTIFYTPTYDNQASASYFLDSVFQLKFPILTYIRQTLMTLNLFIIYILVVIYKKINRLTIDGFNLLKVSFLLLQIIIISFAAVFGNNTGRYFYILVPMVIFLIVKELKPVIK